jgi:methyl-accepting chemotaxis protein
MNFLNNMKVGRRMVLGFGIVVVILVIVTGLAVYSLSSIQHSVNDVSQQVVAMTKTREIVQDTKDISLNIADMTLTTDTTRVKDYETVISDVRAAYKQNLTWLKGNSSSEEEKTLLSALETSVTNLRDVNDQIISLASQNKNTEAGALYTQDSTTKGRTAIDTASNDLITYRQNLMDTTTKQANDLVAQMSVILYVAAGIAILLSIFMGVVIARSITNPVNKSSEYLSRMADGIFSISIDKDISERQDEMGDIARAIQHLLANMRSSLINVRDGVTTLASASTELSSISNQLSDSASETSSKANVVAVAAEEMSANTLSVAAGMEQATTNLRSVATATEEMTATIGEIANNSEKARRITGEAVSQADRISVAVRDLGRSAQEIGKVTETITSISNQTNLLALNATIEAARAGAAGKGFAVVATEIKELAQQTAAATEDIKAKVSGVQNSTAGAVSDIEKIAEVIREVSDIVTTIATAIEEQSVVTRDIASNIAEATQGVKDANERVAQTSTVTQTVARDVAGVSSAGQEMSSGSAQVLTSSAELSSLAERLRSMVAQFSL